MRVKDEDKVTRIYAAAIKVVNRDGFQGSSMQKIAQEAEVQNILLHKEDTNTSDYAIIYNTLQKDPSNSEKEAVLYIYRQLRNAEPADDASAREVITSLFFSEKRYDLGEVGRYRITLSALRAGCHPARPQQLGRGPGSPRWRADCQRPFGSAHFRPGGASPGTGCGSFHRNWTAPSGPQPKVSAQRRTFRISG